ncbi:hypothetical protein [Roseicyclus sp.]|uniref:hypothetical protein n=1 Tax=Roseicyclus sp. TaxID=1914329 RepID=UPI003F9F48A8
MSGRQQSALAFLWERHRLAVVALGLAVAVAAFFAVRLIVFAVYWSDPAHRAQPLEGWMTPGYVAHSYGIGREDLRAALGLAPGDRATLEEIAAARGVDLAVVLAEVEAAIAGSRAP